MRGCIFSIRCFTEMFESNSHQDTALLNVSKCVSQNSNILLHNYSIVLIHGESNIALILLSKILFAHICPVVPITHLQLFPFLIQEKIHNQLRTTDRLSLQSPLYLFFIWNGSLDFIFIFVFHGTDIFDKSRAVIQQRTSLECLYLFIPPWLVSG